MVQNQLSPTRRYSFQETLSVRIGSDALSPSALAAALDQMMADGDLGIVDHLDRMRHDPFFLVAGTGLGKTVVVPVHVWLRQCEKSSSNAPAPTTWIVEPRVLIAEDQARYMDTSIRALLRARGVNRPPPIFGSITSKGPFNRQAPIRFVTTGVFTAMALSGGFSPDSDRIVIDEAHETIAQNADVELGIAVARKHGVHIDYMSATVETSTIPKLLRINPNDVIVALNKRYPIFAVNAKQPLLKCLAQIVDELLVRQDRSSKYLPPVGYIHRDQVLEDVFGGPPRSHALLVALNTISGKNSDLAAAQAVLRASAPVVDGRPIDILELSSAQTSNEQEMLRFTAKRLEIEAELRPYVVLATSVIEMGVTIPPLDFVVTMDSGFQSVTVGDRSIPEIGPLPFNSLKQRLGRVGRKRAGVGIITREVGASYTDLGFEELNSDLIEYEPVRTPLASSRLDSLALYTIKQGWNSPRELAAGIRDLGLASDDSLLSLTRLQDLVVERRALQALGAVDQSGLSALGRASEAWIGAGWLPYAFQLERAWQSGADMSIVSFWLVALATSGSDLGSFLANNATGDDFNAGVHVSGAGIAFIDNLHSPLGRYDLLRSFHNSYGRHLNKDSGFKSLTELSLASLSRDCSELDLSESQIKRSLGEIAALRKRFVKLHRSSKRIGDLPELLPPLTAVARRKLIGAALALPGQIELRLVPKPSGYPNERVWVGSDDRALATVGNSVPLLTPKETAHARFTARLLLRREADKNGFWLDVADYWVQAKL